MIKKFFVLFVILACVFAFFTIFESENSSENQVYATFEGSSMSGIENYHHEELVIATSSENYNRGDVVSATAPYGEKVYKRIAAIPGDHVVIKDMILYINDEIYEYCPEDAAAEWDENVPVPEDCDLVLGDDEYYLVGDNYSNSRDSRYYGPINISDIEYSFSHQDGSSF